MKHKKSPSSDAGVLPPFVPPGAPVTNDVAELHAYYQRELESVKRADDERIEELQLQVRRLKTDLKDRGRILAKTGGLLHELEIEREAREATTRRRKRA